jgi:hypothetical protein
MRTCQAEEVLLLTANRNNHGSDSLEATIRNHNGPHFLPVFTIADVDLLQSDRAYAHRVIWAFYDFLIRLDEIRGAGRLYLP